MLLSIMCAFFFVQLKWICNFPAWPVHINQISSRKRSQTWTHTRRRTHTHTHTYIYRVVQECCLYVLECFMNKYQESMIGKQKVHIILNFQKPFHIFALHYKVIVYLSYLQSMQHFVPKSCGTMFLHEASVSGSRRVLFTFPVVWVR